LLALRAQDLGQLALLAVTAAEVATPLAQVPPAAAQDPAAALAWQIAVTVEPAATTPVVVPTAATAAEVHRAVAAAAGVSLVAVPVLETARAAQLAPVVQQDPEAQTQLAVQRRSGLELPVALVVLALLVAVVVAAAAVSQLVPRAAVVVQAAAAVALGPDRLARAAPAADPLGSMHITRQ
jgi:hypothetical protein